MSEYKNKKRQSNWRSLWDSYDDELDAIDGKKPALTTPRVDRFSRSTRYHSCLGWGSELSSYTDYYCNRTSWYYGSGGYTDFKNVEKAEELLTKAFAATRDMIVILNFPYKVQIQLLDNDVEDEFLNMTEVLNGKSRRIFIPTIVLEDVRKTDTEKINIMCGLGLHESAHLLFSSISVYDSFKEKIPITTANISILLDIINLIEDSRIEDKLLIERPGFFDFINSSKKWSFERFKKSLDGSKYKLLINIYSFIRYPEIVDKRVIKENKEIFDKINEILENNTPDNTKDSCLLGKKLYDILEKELSKIDKLPKLKDYSGGDNILYLPMIYGIDKDSGHDPSGKLVSNTLKDSGMLQKLVYGVAERGDDKNTFFEKMNNSNRSKHLYNIAYNNIQQYIPAIKKLLSNTDKNYDYVIHGCRSGLLDTSKLAEAYQGVPQVYLRQGHVVTNKSTVCVLVDESGSMSSNDRYLRAREAAILLNEALGSLPGIDLYIYGHSADEIYGNEVNIRIYREGDRFKPKYSLGDVDARCQNRDGTAILEVAKRIRKFTNERVIMFVISDGEPAAGDYYGAAAIDDTHNKVLKAEKLGFDIIQVSIYKVRFVEKMFSKFINIETDLSELPKKLGHIIKDKIVNDKKTSIIV